MANIVEMILSATDNASGTFEKFSKGTGSVKMAFTEINSALDLINRGFDAVSSAVDQTVGAFDRYAISVRDSARRPARPLRP